MTRLYPSADTYARAIIGAAKANKDDPLAIASRDYGARRCIPPAVAALHARGLESFATICRPLGIAERQVHAARKSPSEAYAKALVGARLALEPRGR